MIPKEKQAAHMMIGEVLDGGWSVVKKIPRDSYKTGGVYSCCYEVENGSRKGFLKAFDYSGAEKVSEDFAEQMKNILTAFTLERDILEICSEKNCKNVIQLMDHGSIEIEGAEKYPRVHYLILEYAEKGDIRDHLNRSNVTMEWKLRSLHQMAKGLMQIHSISIAHQDLKPSNIVTLENNITKITDFGSAIAFSSTTIDLPYHLKKDCVGSWEYAPPELLYGYVNDDPVIRRIGCDLYLLGSMVVFYFTKLSMTSLINTNLSENLSWTNPANYGNYNTMRSYIIMAFEKSLKDISLVIGEGKREKEIISVIKYLCNPDPHLRGHKKTIFQIGPNYNLERFVTIFDYLANSYMVKGE